MAGHAWLLRGFWDPRIQIGTGDDGLDGTEFFRNFLRKRARQEVLTSEEVPKRFQLDRRERESKLLRCPPTFNGPGLCVREDVADILRQFRLGRTSLFPIAITMGPEQKPAPCPQYYILCVAEQRERLLPELSPGLRKIDGREEWSSGPVEENDSVSLRASPPLDLDLWYDPKDQFGYYCSDELYQALAAAGFGRAFLPLRCMLVDLH